jgi:hypothetical protein
MKAGDELQEAIDRVAALRTCRFCGRAVAPAPAECEHCHTVAIRLPVEEWDRDAKRFLCTQAIERRRLFLGSDQSLFERLLLDEYRGKWREVDGKRILVPWAVTVERAFPFLLHDAVAWVAAGCPTTFKL